MSDASSSDSFVTDFTELRQSRNLSKSFWRAALSLASKFSRRTSSTTRSTSRRLRAFHPNTNESLSPDHRDFWNVPWSVSGAFLTGFGVEIFIFGLIGLVASFIGASSMLSLIVLYVLAAAVALTGAYILIRITRFSWPVFLGNWKWKYLLFIPLYFGLYLLLSGVIASIIHLIIPFDESQTQDFGLDQAKGVMLAATFFVLVVFPPITEEIIYRGIFYRGLRKKWGKLVPALLTSVFFGLAHGQWNVGIDTFVLSLVLILAMERSKSLWMPVGIHMLKNAVAFTILFFVH